MGTVTENEQLYRIVWKSKITGYTGRGNPISWWLAKSALDTVNSDRTLYYIHHWIEPVSQLELTIAQGFKNIDAAIDRVIANN